MKPFFKYVTVILVYRNANDLQECLASFRAYVPNNKIIVVNSFYNEESKKCIEKIALQNNCDFINVPNKGYSYGNNRGIDYAKEHYHFEYLIIANPDTIIQQFEEHFPKDAAIIAPQITARNGKLQNPMGIINSSLAKWLIYQGFKHDCKYVVYSGILINKILTFALRNIKKWSAKTTYPIYMAHGSFLLISGCTLDDLSPVYDENMFLFAEEGVLADKMHHYGYKTYYYTNIKILHKEDGSMKLSNFSLNKELAKSNIYYYEHYVKGK